MNTHHLPTLNTVALHWTCLVPYGHWANPGRAAKLQVFFKKNAQALCEDFFKQAAAGQQVPLYVGHPDDPELAQQAEHQDSTLYGYIVALDARDDGLWAQLAWRPPGWDLLKAGLYHALSVRWSLEPSALLKNTLFPVRLHSAGLTHKPNIPNVHPILMKDQMIELPKKVQELLELPAHCDAQTLEDTLAQRLELAHQDQACSENFYRLASDRQNALEAQQQQLAQLQKELASARQERINDTLNIAILQGRIPGHEAQLWRERLEADFQNGMSSIAGLRPPFASRAPELSKGLPRIGSADRSELVRKAQDRAQRSGERLTLAWSRLGGKRG